MTSCAGSHSGFRPSCVCSGRADCFRWPSPLGWLRFRPAHAPEVALGRAGSRRRITTRAIKSWHRMTVVWRSNQAAFADQRSGSFRLVLWYSLRSRPVGANRRPGRAGSTPARPKGSGTRSPGTPGRETRTGCCVIKRNEAAPHK